MLLVFLFILRLRKRKKKEEVQRFGSFVAYAGSYWELSPTPVT